MEVEERRRLTGRAWFQFRISPSVRALRFEITTPVLVFAVRQSTSGLTRGRRLGSSAVYAARPARQLGKRPGLRPRVKRRQTSQKLAAGEYSYSKNGDRLVFEF